MSDGLFLWRAIFAALAVFGVSLMLYGAYAERHGEFIVGMVLGPLATWMAIGRT